MSDLLIVPNELSQHELDEIVKYFKGLPRAERGNTNHFDFDRPGKPTLFVKYGDDDRLDEASTQSFFYALARKDSSAPRIPAVYNVFCAERIYFIVMEKIDWPTLEDCKSIPDDYATQRVASAVKWLLDQMPSVPSTIFGRISNRKACVWHVFFKDHWAPVPFSGTEAVTKYINKALSRRPGPRAPPIYLPDKLAIYHSDIRKENFLIDVATGDVCVVDFQHIGVLPEPFQIYSLFNTCNEFGAAVGRHIGLEPSSFADMMTQAAIIIQQTGGGAGMGLNEHGDRAQARSITA